MPMADPLAQVSSTGGYPWRIEETSRTTVNIKNLTSVEQEYVAYLKWDGSETEYMIGLQKLSAGKTIQIDVQRLRDQQIPDERGNLIPLNAVSGQIGWFLRPGYDTADEKTKRLALFGRSEQIDTITKISSSYACQNCCESHATAGFVSTDPTGFESPDSYEFEIGDTVQLYAFLIETECNNSTHFYAVPAEDWDSDDENIATVNSGGLVTITGVGDFEIEAEIDGYINYIFEPCPPGGPYLVEACDDANRDGGQTIIDSNKGDVPVDNEAPCGACETFDFDPTPDVDVSAKPKVTITVPPTAMDGDTVTFGVTTTGGTPTAYLWTLTAPSGSGNNPHVSFNTPTAVSTIVEAHWFANPNSPCATNPPPGGPTHPYYNSKYKIKVKVTFQDGYEKTKDADFTVNAWCDPAGEVGVPDITGFPRIQPNAQNVWVVVGPGNLTRVPQQTPTIHIPQASQFHNKTVAHENVHIGQWNSGQIFQNYITVNGFMARLANLSDISQPGLVQQIRQAYDNYRLSEVSLIISTGDLSQAEIAAYNVSDPIAPMFAYQRCGRTTWP